MSALPNHQAAIVRSLTRLGIPEPVAIDAAANLLTGFLGLCGDIADRRGLDEVAVAAMWHAADQALGGADADRVRLNGDGYQVDAPRGAGHG